MRIPLRDHNLNIGQIRDQGKNVNGCMVSKTCSCESEFALSELSADYGTRFGYGSTKTDPLRRIRNSAQCLLIPLRVDPRCAIGIPSRFGPRMEKDRGREPACSVFFEVAEEHRELMRRTEATDIMGNHF